LTIGIGKSVGDGPGPDVTVGTPIVGAGDAGAGDAGAGDAGGRDEGVESGGVGRLAGNIVGPDCGGVAIGSDGTLGGGIGAEIGGRLSGGGAEPGWPKPCWRAKAAVRTRPPPSVNHILRPNIARSPFANEAKRRFATQPSRSDGLPFAHR
jgi:hypothetical protein